MTTIRSKTSKFWAYVALIAGGTLLFGGVLAAVGYLGLPFTTAGEDILTPQLGQMAAIFLGLVGGGLAVYHGLGSIYNRSSSTLKLPPFYFFWIVFAVVLGLGAVPVGAFDDDRVSEVLWLPDDHEPLYIIPVGHPG